MATLHVLLLALSVAVFQPSKSELYIPFKHESLSPSYGLRMMCMLRNESFVGWFKVEGMSNIKIPVAQSSADVKDKPAVVIETDSNLSKTCTLVFPRGVDLRSAGGKYICRGEMNEETAFVLMKFNLDSLQTTQSLHQGRNGTITLGAFSYPLSRFQWRKDNVDIDFESHNRFTLQDDGSIHISNVQKSDAGIYNVKINWENRVVKDFQIKVRVTGSLVFVPFTKGTLVPSFGLSIVCYIRKERFIGWFNADTNIKIPVVPSRAEVKDKPAVVIATVSNTTNEAFLIFPRGSSASNAGKYFCRGEFHRAGVTVVAKYDLE